MPKPFTILLVEDDAADAYLMQLAFAETGLQADWVHKVDGIEALAWLDHGAAAEGLPMGPDLILLDLNMPRMDGWEFLSRIKQDARLNHLPVVVCSTSGAPHDRLQAYRAHAAGYLVKPLDIDTLRCQLQKLIEYWRDTVCSPFREDLPSC